MKRKYWTLLLLVTALLIVATYFFLSTAEELPPACEYNITTCTQDRDCGESGFYGEPYCEAGDVWRAYYQTTCTQPGTRHSACESEQTQRLVESCAQGCEAGNCT